MIVGMRALARALVLLAMVSASAVAQAPLRHVATAHAISTYGHFFHGSSVTFLGTVSDVAGVAVAPIGDKQRVVVLWQQPEGPEGPVILRGTLFDISRLEPADPRLATIDTEKILDAVNEGRMPGRDEVFLLTGARAEKYEPSLTPNVRAIAIDPARWAGKQVTVSGRFRGKNILGDQPTPPGQSPHEFVIRVADASIWVSGIRPRGRGFVLDPASRRDTREWVRVSGIVRHEPPLVWIEGKTVDLAKPETEAAPEPEAAPLPPGPPPEIIFSAPLDGEMGVSTNVVLRVQFSRDIDPESLRDQVAVAYGLKPDGTSPGPAPKAETTYRPANRAVEIRFSEPLAAFATVNVAFGDQIKATDGVFMKPTRISFTTGR